MSWEAIGAIGEIVGALGVILSRPEGSFQRLGVEHDLPSRRPL